ncbi:hypothetical protein POM88_032530 [Heracleum sosnowskyi]|uniref:Uncharacterized protein n=1 Tax=Heracleum sosnowskyi TaxID=360622 RepID=A0AAD8MKQ7_9APIA|nr:hypothetical protein POM88_032530 [Heracleum sosnowskyi]
MKILVFCLTRNVILETDNHEVYRVIKNFNIGTPAASGYDIADPQIDIFLRYKSWLCTVGYGVCGQFNEVVVLAEQMFDLGVGMANQEAGVGGFNVEVVFNNLDNEEMLEEYLQGGAAANQSVLVFGGDVPLKDID